MNFHFRMPWSKPEPAPLRFVVATREESLKARRKRADVVAQLAVYCATTTPEQRAADTEAFLTKFREEHASR